MWVGGRVQNGSGGASSALICASPSAAPTARSAKSPSAPTDPRAPKSGATQVQSTECDRQAARPPTAVDALTAVAAVAAATSGGEAAAEAVREAVRATGETRVRATETDGLKRRIER